MTDLIVSSQSAEGLQKSTSALKRQRDCPKAGLLTNPSVSIFEEELFLIGRTSQIF
jgi:hypothetical protein